VTGWRIALAAHMVAPAAMHRLAGYHPESGRIFHRPAAAPATVEIAT